MTLTNKEQLIIFITMLTMMSRFGDLPPKKVSNKLRKHFKNNYTKLSPTKAEKTLNDVNSQMDKFDKILFKIYKELKK